MPNINRLKKYHFIYKTTNLINGKFYIGMHSTSKLDDGYLGSGKRLLYSVNKYGIDNFKLEILEYCNSREELIEREIKIVDNLLLENKLCMNLREGGLGGFTVEMQRQNAIKSNIKQKILRETNPEWVKHKSDTMRKLVLEQYNSGKRIRKPFYDFTGHTHSVTTKRNIGLKNSIKQKGEGNSQYGTCWIMKDEISKKIKKEELPYYLSIGWIKGRRINK